MGRVSQEKKQRRALANVPGTPTNQPTVVRAQSQIQYQGPLPPAAQYAGYEQTLPGSAHRILAMAEDQAHHRQKLELYSAESERETQQAILRIWGRNSGWGLVAATVLGLAMIGGGIFLIWQGKSAEGLGTIGTAVVSLAGVFVWGETRKEKARQ